MRLAWTPEDPQREAVLEQAKALNAEGKLFGGKNLQQSGVFPEGLGLNNDPENPARTEYWGASGAQESQNPNPEDIANVDLPPEILNEIDAVFLGGAHPVNLDAAALDLA